MLTRSKDRKVTNDVTPNGKSPRIANTFGLPNGPEYSCPSATNYCHKICYAGKLEKVYKGVRKVLTDNYNALKDADLPTQVSLLSAMINDFRADCEKRNADMLFRIHWDGDFFDMQYTIAWAEVITRNPDIRFWVYTRNPFSAEYLHSVNPENLTLYFSSDPDNIETARDLEAKGILIAHVDETFTDGKAAFPTAVRCPENNKAIPLISEKGSACKRCGLCIDGRRNVLFSRTKR